MKLENKVALVTGGSRGIGRAIALEMAQEGAFVAINYQNRAEAALLVQEEIEAKRGPGTAACFRADVADPEQAVEMVRQVVAKFGRLDVLVNNAGVSRDGLVAQMPSNHWREVMDVNFGGTFNCTRAALEFMMRERQGAIINISSVMGERAWQGLSNYAASKAAVNAFTRCTALEVARFGIRVNAIASGFASTEMVAELLNKYISGILRQIPMHTVAEPLDVARAVIFLATEDSRYMTGEILNLDGGASITLAMGTPNPR